MSVTNKGFHIVDISPIFSTKNLKNELKLK